MNSIFIRNYENFMLFFTFFLFWVSIQFGEVVEDFLAYIMVISVGILHGANDLLILSTKEQKDKKLIKNCCFPRGDTSWYCVLVTRPACPPAPLAPPALIKAT